MGKLFRFVDRVGYGYCQSGSAQQGDVHNVVPDIADFSIVERLFR